MVSHLTGRLRRYNLDTHSKDHIRNKMPTRVKIIPYLSRKDRDPQKQYPIGGTYLSIYPIHGTTVGTSPGGLLGCTKYNLNEHGLQNSLVWWYISSQTSGRCYTNVEK